MHNGRFNPIKPFFDLICGKNYEYVFNTNYSQEENGGFGAYSNLSGSKTTLSLGLVSSKSWCGPGENMADSKVSCKDEKTKKILLLQIQRIIFLFELKLQTLD